MNKIKLFSFIAGSLAIIILCTTWYVLSNFGEISIAQIVFNLGLPITGADAHYIASALKFLVVCLLFLVLYYLLVYRMSLFIKVIKVVCQFFCGNEKNFLIYNSRKRKVFVLIFSYFFLFVSILFSFIKLHFVDLFIVSEIVEDDFVFNNYFVPRSEDIKFEIKNSIIVILAESMENTFSNKNGGGSLTPHLDQFKSESQYSVNMSQVFGTGWTIAALCSWSFGVPLKLPKFVEGNSYISKKGFLPSAKSIFDILYENDYSCVLIMGSDSRFSGMDKLFKSHGNFSILDKQYWLDKNWKLKDYQGTQWGFSDKFVLERALEVYQKLKKTEKNFILLVQTIDTHGPNGYCPTKHKKFNDVRDSFLEADLQLGNFISLFKKLKSENEILAIIGDHNFMGPLPFKGQDVHRTLYNAFYGNVPFVSDSKRKQSMTAVDVAPTLLHSAGAKWNNNKFGLGISLFAEEQSLSEQFGAKQFNDNLKIYSEFYSKFFDKNGD